MDKPGTLRDRAAGLGVDLGPLKKNVLHDRLTGGRTVLTDIKVAMC